MKKGYKGISAYLRVFSIVFLFTGILLSGINSKGQTFEFPSALYLDSLSLQSIVSTTGSDIIEVEHDDYQFMSSSTTGNSNGNSFTIKSLLALTEFKVNVQSPDVGQNPDFTYMITYRVYGANDAYPGTLNPASTNDTLTISYDGDSLKLINDRSFEIAGSFHKIRIEIFDVIEITNTPTGLQYQNMLPGNVASIPTFVYVFGKIYTQKYIDYPSLSMTGQVSTTDNISVDGTIHLDWGGLSEITPAGYEVEWTYTHDNYYNFTNNSSRVFTNNTSFNIPVAQKKGTIVYRVRMVRPDLQDLASRTYGSWSLNSDNGDLSSASGNTISIPVSSNDSLNWDLKMNFVEDGKYKQVITYYDGLLKSKQVQTRFNTTPSQTIVAQTLYDHEGRAVINSLPIPVQGANKFSYVDNFLHPLGSAEYAKLSYDALPDMSICPPKEVPVPPLDPTAVSNQYYSEFNVDKSGKNAFIPDAEGYPLVRKIYAAENNDKLLFEGMAGAALQLGNDRHTSYLYGAPLQAELNKYFGQDVGRSSYYRKMITTDNHDQDMFTITDEGGKTIASGLIGTPDTNLLALSIKNEPADKTFQSNLLPIPDVREGDHWTKTGSYFVETETNYEFRYHIEYDPFIPCASIPNVGLKPKIYYNYQVFDYCGNEKLSVSSHLGDIGTTSSTLLQFSRTDSSVLLKKGKHTWNKHSYIKMDDVRASVDVFLDNGYDCFLTFDQFLKDEFLQAEFPCSNSYDPCGNMRLAMIKEMYPREKYGHYVSSDTLSKKYTAPGTNSIFSPLAGTDDLMYQSTCIQNPVVVGNKSYDLRIMKPDELIEAFNDSIGAALLPLHPEYCKLQLCEVIRNPYTEVLRSIETVAEAFEISRLSTSDIVSNDPLFTSGLLTWTELLTNTDSQDVDSIAYIKTICGSDFGIIESVCNDIYATSQDIFAYPVYIQDEYYRTLIALYTENREERLGKIVRENGSGCAPCSSLRLDYNGSLPTFSTNNDTTLMVTGMNELSDSLNLPGNSSFGNYFDPAQSANITADSLNNLKNADNSIYCTELVTYIINALSNCEATSSELTALEDTLKNRFCTNNNSITALTYDSLTHMITEAGIDTNDLCNAGLVDIREVTRKSNNYVQLGLVHYSPIYYDDLKNFLSINTILDFIADSTDTTTTLSLLLCDEHPFQQKLASELGATLTPANCSTSSLSVDVVKYSLINSNAVKLSFRANSKEINYFIYPSLNGEYNALNTDFGETGIYNTSNYSLNSLFNPYGFDKLSKSFANRNTIIINFDGVKDNVTQKFTYFLSAFNTTSDYNLMEKDEKEYLSGVGCSEFIPMAKNAIAKAGQLGIRYGHPFFEKFIANVINDQNSINFDFDNYKTAIQSCGVSDSIVIEKNIAHFRIKFPTSINITDVSNYIDTLRNIDSTGIGISDAKAYSLNSNIYLLLNVFETTDTNIKETRQIITSYVPAGSVIEYMPHLSRDTVAQMFLYDLNNGFDPSQLLGHFPGAVVTLDNIDVYHFISGYGVFTTPATFMTIENTGISDSNDYYYNHYTNSIYELVNSYTPMTTFFYHAEPFISDQYDDWQMQAWRDYVRNIPSDNHNELIKASKADQFQSLTASGGGYSFSSSNFSYVNSKNPYFRNDLIIDHEPSTNTNYDYIKDVINGLNSLNNNKLLINRSGGNVAHNLVKNGTETRAYVCGDTSQFWINHFDASSKMTNIFIRLPEYLPLPRDLYGVISISKGFEKDTVTYMNISLRAQQGSVVDTIHCIAYTDQNLGETYTIPTAFLSSHSNFETLSGRFRNCETRKLETLYPIARVKYNLYRDSVRSILVGQFRQHIIDNIQEQLTILGKDIKHGVTLYYYDLAGNLIKTIPPAGINELDVTGNKNTDINNARLAHYDTATGGGGVIIIGGGGSPLYVPGHTKATTYYYNAQNKVTETNTPDAGKTINFYDKLGRVMISQNDKHRDNLLSPTCTYYIYDNLSRVVETGLTEMSTSWDQAYFSEDNIASFNVAILNASRKEVTRTIYDDPTYESTGVYYKLPRQQNLKNRVSCVKYFDAVDGGIDAKVDTNYANAFYYSYDVSGNVQTQILDNRNGGEQGLRFKRVDYEYDLYSGKVLMVSYNRGNADQFYQKYSYDSDNRIVDVHTSNNGIFWDRDAHYQYYEHGPLARTEIGEQRVQGIDYAYTINGWLKAINGIQNTPAGDMGEDGSSGMVMPTDILSQRIDYFNGDYKAIEDTNFFSHFEGTPKSLYNGNIAAVATALAPFDNIYKKYHYDPLQRISRADYEEYVIDYNTPPTPTAYSFTKPDYASDYKYDPDGNILELKRQGGYVDPAINGGSSISRQLMDSFSYTYKPYTNRLTNLAEHVSTTAYGIDIQHLPPDTLTRYSYDDNGNLTQDLVSGLSKIEWFNNGKVKSIHKVDGTRIHFTYDPMGNRLVKEVISYPSSDSVVKKSTIYVRDASGNVLAVYEDTREIDVEKIQGGDVIDVLTSDPNGVLPIGFTYNLADRLYQVYVEDGSSDLAILSMGIPTLDDYVNNNTQLEDMVSMMHHSDALSFLMSIPDITSHTLNIDEGGTGVMGDKLSTYMQPILLSDNMDAAQTDIFTELKMNNPALYDYAVSTVPATTTQKNDFPGDPSMLIAFKGMEPGDRLSITNEVANSLTAEHIATYPFIAQVLLNNYDASNNGNANFVTELPEGDLLLDVMRQDAVDYIAHRYALVGTGELDAATVQNQFKNNTVLANVLAQQSGGYSQATLASVVSTHFADVVTMAANNGQTDVLVTAFRDVISKDRATPATFNTWMKDKEILTSQRQHLAEHHIYGSSRVGIQKYLPDEVKYHYARGEHGTATTNNLITTKPWYSRYANDLFQPTLYHDSLTQTLMGNAGMGVVSHMLGNRHYELTNHLGNVQATVLDRVTPVLEGVTLLAYSADVSTSQDYYPFGMLMPGRYVSDTAKKCVTTNTTILIPHYAKKWLIQTAPVSYQVGSSAWLPVYQLPKGNTFEVEKLHVYHYNAAATHPGGQVISSTLVDGKASYTLSLSDEPSGGVSTFLQLHADTGRLDQEFGFDLSLPPDCQAEVRVRQYTGTGDEYYDAVPWMVVDMSGPQQLSMPVDKVAVGAGGNTLLEMRFVLNTGADFPSGTTADINTYYIYVTHYTPQTLITTICDEKDNYRFGFNGQEKVNEMKGIGNHMTAEFWEYDTRLGRRWNLDPVDQISISNYAAFANSPIRFSDPLGNVAGDYYKQDGTYLGSDGIDDNKAYVADGKTVTTNKDGTSTTTFDNATELSASHSTLLRFSSAIHNESSGNMEESYAIGSAFTNFVSAKNSDKYSLENIVSQPNSYSFGVSAEHFGEFMSAYNSGNGNSKFAIGGAINALTGGKDYSNGAILWDGGDIVHKSFQGGSKRSWGLLVGNEHATGMNNRYQNKFGKNFISLSSAENNKGSYGLQSSGQHGGSIFWKYHSGSTSHRQSDFLWMKFYNKPKF